MFGAILRAAPQAVIVALLAAIMAKILGPITAFTLESPNANESDLLMSGIQAASDNAILIGLLALALVLVARAVLESQVGGY